MAVLIFRPFEDNSLPSTISGMKFSSGNTWATLINESVTDDDATYIYTMATGTISNQSSDVASVSATCDVEEIGKIRLKSVRIVARARVTSQGNNDYSHMSISFRLCIGDGKKYFELKANVNSTNYSNYESTIDANDLEIDDTVTAEFYIPTTVYKGSSKNDNFEERITQVYAELTYEKVSEPITSTGVSIKLSNSWKEVKTVYKKVDNIWEKQDSPKNLFSGSSTGSESNYIYCGEISS